MVDRLWPHAANALTAVRALLAPVFVVAVVRAPLAPAYGWCAVAVYTVAVLTDVWDGRVARRVGSATATGRAFDHFTDIGFILTALCADVAVGLVPWWVPASIAASFLFYVVDSWSRPRARSGLIGSSQHHYGVLHRSVLLEDSNVTRHGGFALFHAGFPFPASLFTAPIRRFTSGSVPTVILT